MPYSMSWEEKGVYKQFTGHVSYQEFARSQELVLSDYRSDDIRYVINDFLEIEGYSITTDQAEYLAVFNRGSSFSNPRIRVACVTTDVKIIVLIRLVSVLSSYELKTFPTLAAARDWCASSQ
jgi:hypothetical protein